MNRRQEESKGLLANLCRSAKEENKRSAVKRKILLIALTAGFGLAAQQADAQSTQAAQTTRAQAQAAQAQTAQTAQSAKQERDNANPRHELSLTGGYGVVSGLDYDVLGGENKLKSGFRAGLGYTWFFHKNWGLGTGLEYARYNNRVTLPDGMRYATPSTSIEPGSTAQFIVNSSGFLEKQELSMLQIPLTLQWNAPAGKRLRIYALAGGKIGLPISGSWSQTAANLSTGWLHSYDGGGWTEDGTSRNNYAAQGDLKTKPAYMLTAELGAKFRMAGKTWIYVGGYFDYGLNDVRKGATDAANLVADARGNSVGASNSILAMNSATSGARPLAYGVTVRIGLGWGKRKPAPVVVPPPAPAPKPAPAPAPAPAPRPEPVKEIPVEIQKVMIDLSDILFAFDRYDLRDEAKAELDKVAAWLLENPELPVEIGGHTDSYGTDEYNQRLSENRAKSVHDYFVGKGVADSRISYRGYGESQPVATNDTAEGRQRNRRVELKIED